LRAGSRRVRGGSASKGKATTVTAPGGTKDQSKWPPTIARAATGATSRARGQRDRGPRRAPAERPPRLQDVRRGDARHKTLVCREIDTNLDGIKDVVRTFNAKGEAVHEEADRDYDAVRISGSTSSTAACRRRPRHEQRRRRTSEVYVDGQLQRIRRDRNFDGKPDIWRSTRAVASTRRSRRLVSTATSIAGIATSR